MKISLCTSHWEFIREWFDGFALGEGSGRQVRLLETLIQSRDHPACLQAEQALYLKGYILQVI
jgi:23S rRNA G2069 N7-methylase RlmK/C1962 C5-methylase RlmI